MAKVLLVEDDSDLLQKLMRWLKSEGFTVEGTSSGEDAAQMLDLYKFDVVVMDWSLPGMTGLEVLKKFRAAGGITPIIMLTGRSQLENKKAGLDGGADDYLTKPFDEEELSARIRALMRRTPVLAPKRLCAGSVTIEPELKRVSLAGVPVKLGKKEYELLEFLMQNPNRCYSARELVKQLGNLESEGGEDALYSCMKQLRSKLANEDGTCVIVTVHGEGYKVADQ